MQCCAVELVLPEVNHQRGAPVDHRDPFRAHQIEPLCVGRVGGHATRRRTSQAIAALRQNCCYTIIARRCDVKAITLS